MKNYLREHYEYYYIQTSDGETVETTRVECIAPGETETADSPYKQRWLYDTDAGYIIRLTRNEQGERLYRENATYIKREERKRASKYSCIRKNTGLCDNNCNNCTKQKIARTVDLDKPLYTDECGNDVYLELPVYPFAEMFEREEEKELKTRLYKAITQLPNEQRIVIGLHYFKKKSQAEIAEMMGKNQSSVSRQIQTAIKNLKKLLS